MRFPSLATPALALCAAALLAAPVGAQPVSGQMVAQDVTFEGAADQAGTLLFLAVKGVARDVPAVLNAHGAHITSYQFDAEGYEARTWEGGFGLDTLHALDFLNPQPPTQTDVERGELALAGPHGEEYFLHVFSGEGATLAGHLTAGEQKALQQPRLDVGGISEKSDNAEPLIPARESQGGGSWTTITSPVPHVLTQATAAGALRLSGTFTIEVVGLDFQLRDGGKVTPLASGFDRSPVAPGGLAGDNVRSIRESFLRIVVTDGSLELAIPPSGLQWSGPASDTVSGSVQVRQATGVVELSEGGQQRLTGGSYRLDGRYELLSNPAQQGLQLAVTGLDEDGHPIVPASVAVRPAAPALYWVAAVAVSAGAAIAVLAVALLRRRPTMADVESALEAGHFRRAARDAGQLLRSRPGFEDAMISRAIALSKLGRNRRVVREIRAHFAAREPSDGVLHYVLGLALRETGDAADAQAAWREAIRRTPGLLPQVQPLLATQQSSSPAGALAPVVDGTAYA